MFGASQRHQPPDKLQYSLLPDVVNSKMSQSLSRARSSTHPFKCKLTWKIAGSPRTSPLILVGFSGILSSGQVTETTSWCTESYLVCKTVLSLHASIPSPCFQQPVASHLMFHGKSLPSPPISLEVTHFPGHTTRRFLLCNRSQYRHM